ncbi:tetratricopeptide repeat protein [Microcoleus sp. B3-A4]|uniref:tetratricopeptide repeat protein n=1 Tax=Microcoleus sp. B3-A4 TaxID=2818653 RepID=UPI002FCF62F9
MQTLYIKLVPLEKQFVELRYAFGEPARYETQRLDVSSIDNLIQKAKGSYYMSLPDLKGMGHQLFCWLDGTGRWLSRAINDCTDEGLVLALDVRERLGHLPWETLHDGAQFIVERVNPVIVPIRWVDRPVQDSHDIQQGPLRLLFMATSPDNVEPSLDFEQEEAQILTETRDIPLDLRVEESGCITELSKLWGRYREPFDVFHLTGHSSIEDEKPFFLTETETGERHIAYASEIATALRFRMPQLVFLSGCRTGEAPSNGAVSSLAESLIEEGCRAVLSWGRPIADVVATQAAAYLYSQLAAGYQLAEALANTYQHLREAKVEDWHLLRLYVSGKCPKALVEPLGDRVWLPEEPIYEQFLDSQGIVRVATPQEFVGRRRILQRSLRALRAPDKLGVILHGLGGVGKSTIAARLLERLQGYHTIFIYRQLDEDKLLRQLAEQCLSETGQEILQGKLPLTQKLTKFLREGLNERGQSLIFVLDDFEANLELRTDGIAVLKPDTVPVLMPLLKAISQSRLHRVIITSRYDFPLPELDQRLYREQLAALSGADLQKKCNRLISFAPGSEVDLELRLKALKSSAGNPRLLEGLNKVLQVQHLNQEQILEEVEKTSKEFRESISAQELLEQQPPQLRRMLSFCLVYQLPVPASAIKIICPESFEVDSYIPRSVALGLLDRIHSKEETLYEVSRILEPLLDFPEDSIDLYKTAVEYLHQIWFAKGLQNAIETKKELLESSLYDPFLEQDLPTDRLFELYRLATAGLRPDVLITANWFLVTRLNKQKRYREVATLCKFVYYRAYGDLGVHIVSPNLLYYLAKAQQHIGEVEEALHNYQEALDLCSQQCETQKDFVLHKITKASILHDLAGLHNQQGNYQKALELCLQVIQIDEYTDNDLGQAISFNQLAEIRKKLGEPEEALKIYKKAYEFAKKLIDKDLLFTIQTNMAALQVDLGQIDAWDNLLSGLVSDEVQSKNFEFQIKLLSNTASQKLKQGEIEEARKLLEQLNNLLPQIDNLWLKAALLHNLATFRSECGERELALELYHQALELHRNNGDRPHEALTLQEIGILHKRQNNSGEALKFLEESYQLSLKIGNKETQANVLLLTAEILIDRNEFCQAEAKINTALELASTIKLPQLYALALRDMGLLQIKQGNYDAGTDFLRQALEQVNSAVDVVLHATILKLLGEVLSTQGDVDEALKHLTDSLELYSKINQTEDIKEVHKLIGDAHSHRALQIHNMAVREANLGHVESGIKLIEQAFSLVEEVENEEIRAFILLSWGNFLIIQGDFEIGISKVFYALKIAEEQQLSRKQEMQDAALAVQYGKIRQLFELSQEKCQSQELDDALTVALQCLRLAELLKDVEWRSGCLSLLGQIKVNQGDYEGGILDIEMALSLAQENQLEGIHELQQVIFAVNGYEAVRLYQKADSARQEGNLENAIELAWEAFEFQCRVNHKNNQPDTLCFIGQLLIVCNQPEEGLNKLQQALDIAQELQAPEIINLVQEVIDHYRTHQGD